MALCFALGSTCFLVGPFPGYVQLVGAAADGVTFFVGSILFTAGGALAIVVLHRTNIARLVHGQESKMRFRSPRRPRAASP